MEKDQDLRPCFLSIKLRQGRSLWLPTQPYQRTNRYAVVGAMPAFFTPTPHQLHTNRCVVASVMPMFVLLYPRISHTNSYAVDGVLSVFHLLHPRIGYTNSYAVVGVMPSFYRPTARLILDTTDLLCLYVASSFTPSFLRLSLSTTSAMAPSPVTLHAVPKLSIAM